MNNVALYAFLILATIVLAVVVLRRLWDSGRGDLPAGYTGPVKYTRHAEQRMVERGITRKQVEMVLAAPTRQKADASNGSVRLERHIEDRILMVCVVGPWPSGEPTVIKTAYWDDYRETFAIPEHLVGAVIGRGGRTIEVLRTATGARIWVAADGTVQISSSNRLAVRNACQKVEELVRQHMMRAGVRSAA